MGRGSRALQHTISVHAKAFFFLRSRKKNSCACALIAGRGTKPIPCAKYHTLFAMEGLPRSDTHKPIQERAQFLPRAIREKDQLAGQVLSLLVPRMGVDKSPVTTMFLRGNGSGKAVEVPTREHVCALNHEIWIGCVHVYPLTHTLLLS